MPARPDASPRPCDGGVVEQSVGVDSFMVTAVAHVRGGRVVAEDDDWGSVESTLEFDSDRFEVEVLAGLDDFSHVDVVFVFDQVDERAIHVGARHPRNRRDWPLVGIFAQRARARPNRIGVTTCELVAVEGLHVRVRGLDAVDGTPVLDVKPYMREFAPRSPTRQPAWVDELMAEYWER
jgi:tRNA-Thr(GGU) m(6)t(6)A37 methyltransferase TsaA